MKWAGMMGRLPAGHPDRRPDGIERIGSERASERGGGSEPMASKIIRDPLYNYISIDAKRDGWLLELLDTPEVQRLRRIHQLGVSSLTYPGAVHNRLAHSLGVVHLMQQALEHLARSSDDAAIRDGRAPVLASALIHDVGHGPFSHVAEACLGVDHEQWSGAVVLSDETKVREVLLRHF